jgi:hypothetical protein
VVVVVVVWHLQNVPKKTKKEAIYFKKNQILASLEDGKIFWEESV